MANHIKASNESSMQAWIVAMIAGFCFFYQFMQMNLFNSLGLPMLNDLGYQPTDVGSLSSSYLIGIALFSLPAGVIIDLFPARKIILSAMLISIAAAFIFPFVTDLNIMMLLRFIQGSCHTFCFLTAMKLISLWFPANRQAFVCGIVITMGMLGGVFSQAPISALANAFSWETALHLTSTFGLIVSLTAVTILKDKENNGSQIKQFSFKHYQAPLQQACGNKHNWYCGSFIALLNIPVMVFGAAWGSLYLIHTFNVSETLASSIISMIFVGMLCGSPIMGWLSDHLQRRRLPMQVSALITLGLILSLFWLEPTHPAPLFILFFAIGFFSSGQIIGYPLIKEINTDNINASAISLASVLIMLFSSIITYLFGLDISSSNALNFNFSESLYWIVGSLVSAGIIGFLLPESHANAKAS